MKQSQTGKPLCSQCRHLATHRMTGYHDVDGQRQPFYVYHCDEHVSQYDTALTNIVNVFLSDSPDTVEVTITYWDSRHENGTGVLANGMEVSVFTSYDGDGHLVLSDQDTERYQTMQYLIELENKHFATARKEVEARKRQGLPVTPEWLDALERKHNALAQLEIAQRDLKKSNRPS